MSGRGALVAVVVVDEESPGRSQKQWKVSPSTGLYGFVAVLPYDRQTDRQTERETF